MPRSTVNPAFVSEMEMKVLAVLKLNDGMIEDKGGHAIARLWKLSTIEKRSQASSAVHRLVQKGLVIKDTTVYAERKPTHGGSLQSAKTFAVALVNDDQEVDQWAIDELREQIRYRMENPIFRHPRQQETFVPGPKAKVEAKAEEVDEDQTPEEKIADAILAKVFYHAQNPVIEERVVVQEVKTDEKEVQQLKLNIEKLHKIVDEQAKENESLKRQLAEVKGELARNKKRHGEQGVRIRESLPPEQLQALEQLMKQKPREKG
jgi:hypothetical protein